MPGEASRSVHNYLKAIHDLGGPDRWVSTKEVASRLGVRVPSATGMVNRLVKAGWIDCEPGEGARLTAKGLAEAHRVIRRQHLVENFLVRVLGLDRGEARAEADAVSHVVSPRLERALADHLGEPPQQEKPETSD